MKAKIEIELDNDAFQPSAGPELARILRNLANDLDEYPDACEIVVADINGNSVGYFEIEQIEDWQGCSHFDGYPGY
jgi:hypothetical protein|tara:strand:- start:231 stop:458 length:228 start_codon:yes stop_codon:yes gene_type:complete